MGQGASSLAKDAIKPESISGPMPLARPRSSSGASDAHRMRREHRTSRDHTGPISSSSAVDSSEVIHETQSQSRSTAPRRSSTMATAPPPYTAEPVGMEVQVAEAPPPPVPPRDRGNSSRRRSTHARPIEKSPIEWLNEPNRQRRTMSHSLSLPGPSFSPSTRTMSPVPMRGVSPAGRQMPRLMSTSPPRSNGVGGFRQEMEPAFEEEFSVAGGTPGIYSPHQSQVFVQPVPMPRARATRSVHAAPSRRGSREDPLEMLRRYKTVMIVDDSSSMEGRSWAEARDALAGLADAAAKYDQEGIDVHFLNDPRVGTNMKNGVEVKRLFDYVRPDGITPTGQKLEELLLAYMARLEESRTSSSDPTTLVKPVNFIVITDGAPTDDPESVIVATARRLDAGHFPLMQVGIQFVQIGTAEDTAMALKDLDDEITQVHGIRDMVDTTPYTGSQFNTELLVKILLGGINRRVDRYGAAAVMD